MSSQSSEASDRSKSFFCHSCSNSFLKHPEAVSANLTKKTFFANNILLKFNILIAGVCLPSMSAWFH